MSLKDYLRIFRAQTAPIFVFLTLPAYLHNAAPWTLDTLFLVVLAIVSHWMIFGHNSLMDTAMGYDLKDPSKQHHPLVTGKVSMRAGHNVIHWGINFLVPLEIILTLKLSPAPVKALSALLFWVVWCFSYNNGLSKESLYSFIPLSVGFAGWAVWGWFLSHETLGFLGWTFVVYIFFTTLYQIGWSGHLKDFDMKERSNILYKMGARLQPYTIPITGQGYFYPGKAIWFGLGVKLITMGILWVIYLSMPQNMLLTLWMTMITILTTIVLVKGVGARLYDREKELKVMSVMEILTICAPMPLLVGMELGMIMVAGGVGYFYFMNRALWGTSYPKV